MPRKSPPRDPNLDHPAVKLYIDICRSTPNHIQRAAIVATVKQLDLYEAVLRQFMLESRPPQRVDWTLERYQNATADRGRQTVGGQPYAVEVSDEELEWMRSRTLL